MVKLDDLSNIVIENKPAVAPFPKGLKRSDDQWEITCENIHYKRFVSVLFCVIVVPIVITVPTILIHQRKAKTSTPVTTTTMTVSRRTTAASSGQMITNTTKWKQDGITIYQEADYDETDVDFNPLDIDFDGSIYVAELIKSRVIQIKFNTTAFSVIAGGNKSGNGNGAHQLWRPTDVVVDQETDTIIICDSDNQRIVRWSRRNATKGEVMISNLSCTGLALSNHRYLYVSISGWVRHELRRWKMEVYNESTLIASESTENPFGPLKKPHFLFIDETGSLYVVDQGNHRIMKWTQNSSIGIVVAGGNDKGDGLAQLNEPTGVTVDHLGNIYIADTYNNRVVRWIKGATEGSTVVGGNGMGNETNQLWLPSDLVFDKYGSLYVFDAVNHRIQKFSIESNEN